MARTIAIWGPTGLATPTCKLMLRSALTTVVETITLTEHATVKRLYTGTVTAAAGDYRFNLLTAGNYVGGGTITIGATDPATYEEDNSLTVGERNAISAALLDLTDGIETSVTLRQAMRAIAAKSAGLISGAGTGTEVVKGIGQAAGGTTRITATVDINGNITGWSLNL